MEYNRYYNRNKGKYVLLLPTMIFLTFIAIAVLIAYFNWDQCLEDNSKMVIMLAGISFSFMLFMLCLTSQIHMLYLARKERNLLTSGYKTKGRIKKITLAESGSVISGASNNSYNTLHQVVIEYIDEDGFPIRYKPVSKFSKLESYYLLYKGDVDISCKGKVCTVIENMDVLYEKDVDNVIKFIEKYGSTKTKKVRDFINTDKLPTQIFDIIEIVISILGSLVLVGTIVIMFHTMLDSNLTVKIIMCVFIVAFFIAAIKFPSHAIKKFKTRLLGRAYYATSFSLEPYNNSGTTRSLYVNFKYVDEEREYEGRALVQDPYCELLSTLDKLPLRVRDNKAVIDYDRLPRL